MEVRVDPDLCEANGVCTGLAPSVFALRDDETLQIQQPPPDADPKVLERARKAVTLCPKGALTLLDASEQ